MYVYFIRILCCVVVVSVNWKLVTLKQIPCTECANIFGNKALSDSDPDYIFKQSMHTQQLLC